MRIEFSRHAKRRLKLYGISETIISGVLTNLKVTPGKQEIIGKVSGLKYPLKVVAIVKENLITIITAYPLKKGFVK